MQKCQKWCFECQKYHKNHKILSWPCIKIIKITKNTPMAKMTQTDQK